ncbi:MAG: hypothetical protein HY318_20740, partial [Armatimonadetes bacterium]|nr:hypothetical protein [Armatimonadota bacterium]
VLLNLGLQDQVTSQAGTLAAWSQLKNAKIKALLADPWAGHNGPRGGQGLGSSWWAALSGGKVEDVLQITKTAWDGLPVIVAAKQ